MTTGSKPQPLNWFVLYYGFLAVIARQNQESLLYHLNPPGVGGESISLP